MDYSYVSKKSFVFYDLFYMCSGAYLLMLFWYKFFDVNYFSFIGGMVFLVFWMIVTICCYVNIVKKALHNLNKCDDEVFADIDRYIHKMGETSQAYIDVIKKINSIYNGEKVDEIIKNLDITRLYARVDFLQKRLSLFGYLTSNMQSIFVSIGIVVFFVQYTTEFLTVISVCVLIVSLIIIFLLPYFKRGQAGSYRNLVLEHELKLLNEKIEELQSGLANDEMDEKLIEAKQVIIEQLYQIKKEADRKQRGKIEDDIRQISNLDLCVGKSNRAYKVVPIYVKKRKCYLVYDKEKGIENNYVGELNLINKEYSILYSILSKYEMISYFK